MKNIHSVVILLLIHIFLSYSNKVNGQIEGSSSLRTNENFSNLQGFGFDEEQNAIVAFEIFTVVNPQVQKMEEQNCNIGSSLLNFNNTLDLRKFNPSNLYKIISTACNYKLSNDKLNKNRTVPKNEIYLLAKYMFPVNEIKRNSLLVSIEAFSSTKIESGKKLKLEFTEGCIDVVTTEQLNQKYPNLKLGSEDITINFESKGQGILSKNSKLFTEVNKRIRQGSEFSYTTETPFREEQGIAFKDYITNNKHILYDSQHKRFASFGQKQIEGDSYGVNKNFGVFFADQTGKIYSSTEIKKDYLKSENTFSNVYDENGKIKGILMILVHQPSFKKSLKDPIENNYHVFYSDFDGKVFINKDIVYGNPENSRCLNPILTIEKNGALEVFNWNSNKVLNPHTELLEIDFQGNIKNLAHKDQSSNALADAGKVIFTKVGNQFIFIGGLELPKINTMQNGTMNSTPPPFAFRGYLIGLFDINKMEFTKNVTYSMNFDQIKEFDFIDQSEKGITGVLTNNFKSLLVKISPSGDVVIEDPFYAKYLKRDLSISRQLVDLDINSYAIDRKNRKIYFISSDTKSIGNTIYYSSYNY
ncbi:MAG: hypothetical protein ABIO44_03965 [Saprospiraceae bacterium]